MHLSDKLSLAAETASQRIEIDLMRRLFVGGLAGSLSIFAKSSLADHLSTSKETTVSPDGLK
jgi:hypothetical protein